MLRTALIALTALAAAPHAQAQEVSALSVQLSGLQPQGAIMLQLFDSEAGYESGRGGRAIRLPVSAATAEINFSGLAPGEYAIRLFHDVNGDGEMNTNPFGIPTEPFAFSNNARGQFGPAAWANAVFTIAPGDNVQAIIVGGVR